MNNFALLLLAAILSGCTYTSNTKEQQMHVYILHGYGASPSHHWFPWLKQELEQQGARATIIDLPASDDPQPGAWQQALAAQLQTADADTWFVAHSLGGIALLQYLADAQGITAVGGYVLVSGFNDHIPLLPQLDAFSAPGLDYEKLIRLTNHRVIIAAEDDTIVPPALSRALAESLDARFIAVPRGGHFLDTDGFTRLPLLLEVLPPQQ